MKYQEEFFNTNEAKAVQFQSGDHIDNKFLHASIKEIIKTEKHGTAYLCKCDKCGSEFERFHNQILRGIGCGVCAGRVVAKGINDIPTTAPWMVKYFPGGAEEASNYTRSCSRMFTPICPFCGRLSDQQTSPNRIEHIDGISCICKDGITLPNKIIRNLMEQALDLGMISSYEKEYKVYDEKGHLRKFDMMFYDVDNNQYLIEMDGGRHPYIQQKHSKKHFLFVSAKSALADMMKDNIAEKLSVHFIRIDCYKSDIDYKKNNLYQSELSSILDLNRIDWITMEDVCYRSIIEDSCAYKKEHPNAFTSEVCDMFGISATTLRKYWTIGNRLGLCEYNPRIEFDRSNRLPKISKNTIDIYVENLDTGENWSFASRAQFCESSEEIFDGDKITRSMIDKRFDKTDKNYIIYDSGLHEYLIWKSKKE